eukprot:m.153450 g.153450  ORF g.153450 m.153450 type:complete len:80 (-) comp16233_c3_seq4:975-1214(-)
MNIDDLPNYLGKRTHEETEVDSEVLAAVGDSSASAEFGLVEAVGEKRTCQQGFSWWNCMMYSMPQQEVVVAKKTGNVLQ